ncbi:transcription factor bHLH96-like isoform X2 [Panicum hallii]|uniref:transcription factor bHLH96-like isoform X2 n=1 Tax=Panicum hallii TaxID=206008 RepID=UPI000DF4DFE1|nr:transcription factor bHLH96-like isoform X2 [Panicum hallii]
MTLEALCAPSTSSDVLVYDTFNAAAAACAAASPGTGSFLFGNAPAVEPFPAPAAPPDAEGENRVQQQGRRKRRRRQRTVKNAEDAESQRMTHIAVERNRRRQMNEYLAVLRSLMPESYVHRASIVSGAIDFVKELEQQVQSLEAQKLALQPQRGGTASERDAARAPPRDPVAASSSSASVTGEAAERPPFARFFRYPQYAWRHTPPQEDGAAAVGAEEASRASAVADVEVSVVVDAHASLRVMARRRPGQLLKMVAGMQALGLAVLHLNVTAAPGELALYTLNLKVEEGCGLTTAEDIAAAAHHVLCIIDAEAAQRLLAPGAGQPDL